MKFRIDPTYKRLVGYATPYKWRLIFGAIFAVIFGASHAGLLAALRYIIGELFGNHELSLKQAVGVAMFLPFLGLVWGIGNFFSKYLMTWVGQRVVMDLRNHTFSHIHSLSLAYFTKNRTGEMISRTTNDSTMVERAVSNVLADLFREPFTLISAVAYILYMDPKLALVSLVVFPVCIIPVALFGRRVRRIGREGQEKLADMVSTIDETINGVQIVKSFCMENREKERFGRQSMAVFRRAIKITIAKSALEPIIVFIAFVGLALVFVYAHLMGMDFEELFTFAIALFLMYEPVKKLSNIHMHIQQSSAAADRIFEIIDTPIEVVEDHQAVPLAEPIHTLELDHISFSYNPDEKVIDDLSLKINAGEFVALVGGSGSGKTTLISLLTRFYDVTSGEIRVNGQNIKTLDLRSFRRQVGMVSQDTVLFHDTISNNIAYGEPEADAESIRAAAEKAHALQFIEEMPEGFETEVGERGVRLSGGQKQRLAIARALLLDPPILLLDEATSALDTESERQVQKALDEMMKERTVIAIAHRLSTIQKADRIIVLKGGRIVEEGSHSELLEKGGHYQYLYDLQFSDA